MGSSIWGHWPNYILLLMVVSYIVNMQLRSEYHIKWNMKPVYLCDTRNLMRNGSIPIFTASKSHKTGDFWYHNVLEFAEIKYIISIFNFPGGHSSGDGRTHGIIALYDLGNLASSSDNYIYWIAVVSPVGWSCTEICALKPGNQISPGNSSGSSGRHFSFDQK